MEIRQHVPERYFCYFLLLHCLQTYSAGPSDQEVMGSIPASSTTFLEIDYEIFFSMVFLFLLLVQEGQLSVSFVECAQVLVNHLQDFRELWIGKLTSLT